MVGMAGQRQEGQQHSNLLVATVSKLLHGLRGVEGRKSDLAQLHRRLFFGGLFFISTWGAQFFLCQSILRSFTNRSKLGRFFFESPCCHLRDCCLCGRLLVASAQHALAATVPRGVDAVSWR